jgi:hypothetical protein
MLVREDVIYSKLLKYKALFRNIAGIVNLNNGFRIKQTKEGIPLFVWVSYVMGLKTMD